MSIDTQRYVPSPLIRGERIETLMAVNILFIWLVSPHTRGAYRNAKKLGLKEVPCIMSPLIRGERIETFPYRAFRSARLVSPHTRGAYRNLETSVSFNCPKSPLIRGERIETTRTMLPQQTKSLPSYEGGECIEIIEISG